MSRVIVAMLATLVIMYVVPFPIYGAFQALGLVELPEDGSPGQFLLSVRTLMGDEMYFLSAIGVRPRATPELIRKGVLISSECGADGITLGHYDGAPLRNLEAIGEGMREADVRVG